MLYHKNTVRLMLSLATLFSTTHSYAYHAQPPVDEVLKNANLLPLINTERPVLLAAQMKSPHESTDEVNRLNEYVAIGVIGLPSIHTNMTSFDGNQTIITAASVDMPWYGVADYVQNEIPNLSLQEGLTAVQDCMKNMANPIPSNRISRVSIYKTLNTSEIIYDYVFNIDYLPKGSCMEYLFSPVSHTCSKGTLVACHLTVKPSSLA